MASHAETPRVPDDKTARTSAGRLVSGVAWNALGRGLPLVLALALTPVLVAQLGVERWGLFTLALALVGVFGILDLGVGPALTRALSERIGNGKTEGEAQLVGAAILTLGGLSVFGAIVVWFGLPVLVGRVLNVPPSLQAEAIDAMRVLVLAAPLVVVNAALWGVLAAHQKFRAANLVTIPVGVFYYLGPVLALMAWDSLVAVMLALVACRLANTLSYLVLVKPLVPGLRLTGIRLAPVLPLLRIGGWMTFSSALMQLLLYADRFLVGAMLTLAAVAYYATPLDLVLRFWILPVAVAQALLPALASSFRTLPVETAALLRRGALLIGTIVLPACLLIVAFAHTLLSLWLGAGFADGGASVLRILGVGILFSCVAFAPSSLIDAIGRPDVTAGFSVGQAVVFLPLSALSLYWFGIEGAAIVWALRSALDCFGRLVIAGWLYPPALIAVRTVMPALAAGGLGLAAAAAVPSVGLAIGFGLAAMAGFGGFGWRALVAEERQGLVQAILHPRRSLRL
ncbi:O-antigen/teichoic acid export membrane protein [Humitalea rosea]|uniref:O-antigen/teichoic acid export membrane protein n=1 Tax=Humitalea rosea TaxID=990373 RepID=A0A2W7IRX8_9PROT|nr:flippase [Humitalea rosea]PZW48344.1 O-antigen/teichoic acid export membrane protein [Humitalea rosea]